MEHAFRRSSRIQKLKDTAEAPRSEQKLPAASRSSQQRAEAHENSRSSRKQQKLTKTAEAQGSEQKPPTKKDPLESPLGTMERSKSRRFRIPPSAPPQRAG